MFGTEFAWQHSLTRMSELQGLPGLHMHVLACSQLPRAVPQQSTDVSTCCSTAAAECCVEDLQPSAALQAFAEMTPVLASAICCCCQPALLHV